MREEGVREGEGGRRGCTAEQEEMTADVKKPVEATVFTVVQPLGPTVSAHLSVRDRQAALGGRPLSPI